MTERDEWWKPENLQKAEKECRNISDTNQLDVRGDFGSYRKVLLTGAIKNTLLDQHNDLNPLRKIKAINRLLKNIKVNDILDAGCGMGFTTEALAKYYKGAKVLGVDVSADAIEFAQNYHKRARFLSAVISPDSKKLGFFDLIFCFEFYPFTRNNDYELQSRFIDYFASQLSPNGKIIIYQLWENHASLSSVINKVIEDLPNLKFSLHTIPNPRLTEYFPFYLARGVNFLVEKIVKRRFSRTVLLIESRTN
jgi:2-polyprenyl-3-methyl-5-hydroxy-6-metoxy-1,4-benzoquinol methylase